MNEIQVFPPDADEDGPRAWCHVMYALHALSVASGLLASAFIIGAFVTGWPSIIAVIINYVTRRRVRDSWLETHWRWQLRTFWVAVVWGIIGVLLILTIVGIPFGWLALVVSGIWVLYRIVRGWMSLLDREPMPVPAP